MTTNSLAVALFAVALATSTISAADPEKEPTEASEGNTADLPEGYVKEAPLPEGFPPPSKVGTIVVKEYPVARTFSAEGRSAFNKNFAYLKKQKHEMTAPVIWEYEHYQEGKKPFSLFGNPVTTERMHFVLEKPSLDEPKEAGDVTVDDLPKMRVLSIAFQGELTEKAVRKAEEQLNEHLAETEGIEADGPPRLMGYNSPFVGYGKKYWEVQIPIQAAK